MGKRKRMAKRPGEKDHKPDPPAHEPVAGPYVVIFVAEDKYNDVELSFWLNDQLEQGFELIGTMTVVGVRHQFACTHGTRFIFKRYAQ